MKINKNQIGGKIGNIVGNDYKGHTVTGYIFNIPVKFATNLSQEDFNKMCDGTCTKQDEIRIKNILDYRGILN